ncbi:hypothetical protein J2X90_004716 [Variovorax paradoxus]|uniref:hypothetical protein n=1 Tax=Variovorax paradoxus TaxID=34073 RepID=UPI002785A7BE|nr:hypothetical protein [Variovorax paradoxus]MDQ0026889.1 hypothetical protein [Variovorax paradoxus]
MQFISSQFGLFCVAFGLETPVLAIGYCRPGPVVRERCEIRGAGSQILMDATVGHSNLSK